VGIEDFNILSGQAYHERRESASGEAMDRPSKMQLLGIISSSSRVSTFQIALPGKTPTQVEIHLVGCLTHRGVTPFRHTLATRAVSDESHPQLQGSSALICTHTRTCQKVPTAQATLDGLNCIPEHPRIFPNCDNNPHACLASFAQDITFETWGAAISQE
jgi:hypothetical protein